MYLHFLICLTQLLRIPYLPTGVLVRWKIPPELDDFPVVPAKLFHVIGRQSPMFNHALFNHELGDAWDSSTHCRVSIFLIGKLKIGAVAFANLAELFLYFPILPPNSKSLRRLNVQNSIISITH